MTDPLPPFTYHPNPVATGAVKESSATCGCCGKPRGYAYVGPSYGTANRHATICPWCIADGSAAAKLDVSFAEMDHQLGAGVPPHVVEEIQLRTPGYESWQGEAWLAHCGDACEFHGDASEMDVRNASDETKNQWIAAYDQDDASWSEVTDGYRPRGDLALYKFICRHCGAVLFGWDMC